MSVFKNFFDRFPAPTASVAKMTVDELAGLMASSQVAGKDYVVVDVRRMDLEACETQRNYPHLLSFLNPGP
jgi:hypothetical protein